MTGTIRRCKDCAGIGFSWKRLTATGCEGQPLDDGELHTCRCQPCEGSGIVDQTGRPVHYKQELGR